MANMRQPILPMIIKKRIIRIKNDCFQFKQFTLSELSIGVISSMLGFNMKDLLDEEHNTNPDPSRLSQLEKLEDKFLEEQKQVYRGNRNVQRRVLRKYIPIIRERFDAPPLSPKEMEKLVREYEDV